MVIDKVMCCSLPDQYRLGVFDTLTWIDKVVETGLALGWDLVKVKDEVDNVKEKFSDKVATSFQNGF